MTIQEKNHTDWLRSEVDRITAERDALAVALDHVCVTLKGSPCYCSPSNDELCERCATVKEAEESTDALTVLAARDARIRAEGMVAGLRKAEAWVLRCHSNLEKSGGIYEALVLLAGITKDLNSMAEVVQKAAEGREA